MEATLAATTSKQALLSLLNDIHAGNGVYIFDIQDAEAPRIPFGWEDDPARWGRDIYLHLSPSEGWMVSDTPTGTGVEVSRANALEYLRYRIRQDAARERYLAGEIAWLDQAVRVLEVL